MTQTPGLDDPDAVNKARGELIKTERRRQALSQVAATSLVNDRLKAAGERVISRGHYANIEIGATGISEPVLRAVADAFGIREAQLRHPFASLWTDRAKAVA